MVTKNIKINFSTLPYNSGSIFKLYTNVVADEITDLTTGSFEGLGYDYNIDDTANKITVECTGGGICVGATGSIDVIPAAPTPDIPTPTIPTPTIPTPTIPTPTPITPTPTPTTPTPDVPPPVTPTPIVPTPDVPPPVVPTPTVIDCNFTVSGSSN